MGNKTPKSEVLLKKLGKRITSLRERTGMNQTELAHRCGKDRQVISLLELGQSNPTVKTLSAIAQELDVPLYELFRFD
jgi:transcriptional regulator with XRE-family HTH domain